MANTLKYTDGTGPAWVDGTTTFTATFNVQSLSASRNYTFPDTTGTISLTSDLSAYALLASPHFSGVPTVPTAAPDTNTTQAASTAFVVAQSNLAASGGTLVIAATTSTNMGINEGGVQSYVFTHTGTLTAYELIIDDGQVNGQEVSIVFNCAVTALTLTGANWTSAGLALPTTLVANVPFRIAWNAAGPGWIRIQ